jgi:signal transduction histidine kinase
MAMGHFFSGRTKESLLFHYKCQSEIDRVPDLFFQSFNAAMACRVALKLSDANAFEMFSQKLEASLNQQNDTRYRLRHTGYRALILNQLADHDAAELHWIIGDTLVDDTESGLERAHYFLYRGLSFALQGWIEQASSHYERSKESFISAGSLPHFLCEVEIAQALVAISCPFKRATSVKETYEQATKLSLKFLELAEASSNVIQTMYRDASLFCTEILDGTIPEIRSKEFASVTLSIIDNVSRSKSFASGLSHFRLVPNFIAAVRQADISEAGVSQAIHRVLKIEPFYSNGAYTLPTGLSSTSSSPEVKAILEFASTLCELGKSADRLFTAEAKLKETQRATLLLHDLRYFSSDLKRMARELSNSDLEMLSGKLTDLIEGHLRSIKTGVTLETPGLVSLSKMLKRVGQITKQMTGKSFVTTGDTNIFFWLSEPLLERVLFNIIKNGLEAGNGEVPVTVNIEKRSDCISLLIHDNGAGIPASILESIADPSKHVVASSKSEGTGLGLKSAFECAHAISSKIQLNSSSPTGSEFEIIIPLQNLNSSFEENANFETLVIDDSRSVIQAWREFALNEGQKIIACTPIESVPILNSLQSSLKWVILDYDLKLPNCNGVTFAEAFLSLGVKIALSTGFRADELPSDARAFRWDAILSKEPQSLDSTSVQNIQLPTFTAPSRASFIRELRHDIRNELTPLKTIYKFVKTKMPLDDLKGQRYVDLFGNTLEEVEGILERARQKELLQEVRN